MPRLPPTRPDAGKPYSQKIHIYSRHQSPEKVEKVNEAAKTELEFNPKIDYKVPESVAADIQAGLDSKEGE